MKYFWRHQKDMDFYEIVGPDGQVIASMRCINPEELDALVMHLNMNA